MHMLNDSDFQGVIDSLYVLCMRDPEFSKYQDEIKEEERKLSTIISNLIEKGKELLKDKEWSDQIKVEVLYETMSLFTIPCNNHNLKTSIGAMYGLDLGIGLK